MILSCLRWLEHVEDEAQLANHMKDLLEADISSLEKELIIAVPDIITDHYHEVRLVLASKARFSHRVIAANGCRPLC